MCCAVLASSGAWVMHCSSNALGWTPSGSKGQCEGRRYLAQDDHGAYLYMHGSSRAMALTQFDRVDSMR